MLAAERDLARELTRRGASVSIVRLPAAPDGTKLGLDDYLVRFGVDAYRALPRLPVMTAPAEAPAPTLAVRGLGDFLAQPDPEPEVFVEGVLSDDGGGWIGGEEKLFKTWYAEEEALSLALGVPVCGRFAVPRQRRVLFLEEEDSPRRTKRRIRALLRGKGQDPDAAPVRELLNAWLRISVWSGFRLDHPLLVEQLRDEVATFRPALVYLDCLRKVTTRNLNHADEASVLLEILDALRREYGCVFRLIQATLAKKARITREYVNKLEAGRYDPTVGVVTRIAKALGVPVMKLLE